MTARDLASVDYSIDPERGTLTPRLTPLEILPERLQNEVRGGARIGAFTAAHTSSEQGNPSELSLMTLLIHPGAAGIELWETPLPCGARGYPSLTPLLPQMHWFEREIADLFGLEPYSHPRPKSLTLHEAWPKDFHPLRERSPAPPDPDSPRRQYTFLEVKGDGVYEVPVGPIHAGIIEPGHFRFSCLGEVIQNLEIRLGYVHRGVEETLTRLPWRHARYAAEAVSSDTTIGNGLAHAFAMEQILELSPGPRVTALRATALEMERVASHIGDFGGISSDTGFSLGAAAFGRLRGAALGLLERLTGSRFGSAYIVPGGVSRALTDELRRELLACLHSLTHDYLDVEPLLFENAGALERMAGTGRVRPSLARDFGLIGPAGRASGIDYDVRRDLQQEPYRRLSLKVAKGETGDVLARAQVRAEETRTSLLLISEILEALPDGTEEAINPLPTQLPASRVGVGIVEAWRGELVHLVFTNPTGRIGRYFIKDPSFHNWKGLTVAIRGELLSDFPLCNKSFGLSYSGSDR